MALPMSQPMRESMVKTNKILSFEKPIDFEDSDECKLEVLIADQLENTQPYFAVGLKDYPIILHADEDFTGLKVYFKDEIAPNAKGIENLHFVKAFFQKDRTSVVLVDATGTYYLKVY